MKTLASLAVLFVVFADPALASCQLDGNDFAALSLSPSKIQDQKTVDALPADQQNALCVTRATAKQLHAQGDEWIGPDDKPDYWVRYLSPAEKDIFVKAATDWINKYVLGK
jgi:hypothetical protein